MKRQATIKALEAKIAAVTKQLEEDRPEREALYQATLEETKQDESYQKTFADFVDHEGGHTGESIPRSSGHGQARTSNQEEAVPKVL